MERSVEFLSAMKSPAAIVIGAASLAAIVGVACGVMQSSSDNPSAPNASQSPIAQSSPATATPTGSAPASTQPNSSTSGTPAASESKQSTAEPSTDEPSPGTRTLESCVVRMAVVNDPNPPLNVRSDPSTTANNVVAQLKNGAMVTVVNEANGWLEIAEPKGWISKQRTQHGCNQKVERVRFGTGGTSATITDQFIGTGSHRYIFTASKGQTMTVTGKTGPFPFVIAPGGKPLVGGTPGDEDRTRWTGQLPQSGEYAIELDSNFRGYDYSFTVTVQ